MLSLARDSVEVIGYGNPIEPRRVATIGQPAASFASDPSCAWTTAATAADRRIALAGAIPDVVPEAWLARLPGIAALRLNKAAASLVIEYDARRIPPQWWERLLHSRDEALPDLLAEVGLIVDRAHLFPIHPKEYLRERSSLSLTYPHGDPAPWSPATVAVLQKRRHGRDRGRGGGHRRATQAP